MPSHTQQDNNESPPTPRFANFVYHETGKLVIPRPLVRMYTNVFQENQKLFLRVPPGTVWEMKLKKEEDGLILHEGSWSEFMKFYCIKTGHLLVFSYNNGSMLDVVIFDGTATEITYPFRRNGSRENARQIEEQNDDVVVDDDNDEGEYDDHEEEEEDDDDEDDECNQMTISHKRYIVNDSRSQKSSGSKKSVPGANPSALLSQDPHFRVVITATYLDFYLHVPPKFANKYIVEDCPAKLCMYDNHGRFWNVHFRFRKFGDRKVRITTGWKKLAQDTNLQAGDICTFYLVNTSVPLHFQVTVMGPAGRKNLNTPANSEHPMFSLTMTEHYLRRYSMPIRTGFLKHLKKEQMVMLQVDDKEWSVKAICYSEEWGMLSKGWYKFREDNNLQVGDTCIFELIQKKNMVFRVSIHRANV